MALPDYAALAQKGMPAEELANMFLRAYFSDSEPVFPINPFQVLADEGIAFSFRHFDKYEGAYIPAASPDDVPVVGINIGRPITRQRYTAAHELCHHIKDSGHDPFACKINGQSSIERYAESFASELLMPTNELERQVSYYLQNGTVAFDDTLRIANYFGVSFQACLYKLAYKLHVIEGDTSANSLRHRCTTFKPDKQREHLGLTHLKLYDQLFDAAEACFKVSMNPRMCQRFKTEFIFHDSRMEGIDIDSETAAEIVVDLRLYGNDSEFCSEENGDIIEVAGLTIAYDFVFDKSESNSENINIYDVKHINKLLFSTAPCPEYGGMFRQSNTLVLGAKFETIDYGDIQREMHFLDKDINTLLVDAGSLAQSDYIKRVLDIHHRLTVIHAFRDGNGRTTRAFTNLLLMRKGIA
ncbi:MAG: ImmA/IrrE family metallo-endopeptidase, partial [Acinetobacter sp.]